MDRKPILNWLAPVLVAGALWAAPAEPPSPIGRWKTMDDRSGKAKSIVSIWSEGGVLQGRIDSLFRGPGENPDPVCRLCPDDRKDKPIKGMVILTGLKPGTDWWDEGRVLDPNNGKIYRCKVRALDGGAKLEVRGYIGISLIGRTQTWIRVP